MTRRDDSKAETRELILNTARQLFWEKSPDKCTVREIAREAGVSPASVIVHFKNKTALLEATLYEEIEKNLSGALTNLPGDREFLDIIMHIVSSMLTLYDKNRELYRILIRDTSFEPAHDSPSMARVDETSIQSIAALIEQEKMNGAFRPEVDSDLAACSLFYLYMGVLSIFLKDSGLSISKAEKKLTSMLQQYLAGLLP